MIILITNIREVRIAGLRIDAHALVVEHPDHGVPARVRGFGTAGDFPVFSMDIPTTEIRREGLSPSRTMLHFGELALEVWLENADVAGLDFCEFPLDESHEVYKTIWATLAAKVARYWNTGTWMPRLQWGPP
jgi:hypothetical protein